jgi:transglutaminase-like putative cysteine protease
MTTLRSSLCLALAWIFFGAAVVAGEPARPSRQSIPLGEHWFSISLDGERTGFASLAIAPAEAGGYLVSGEGSVKMLVLGVSREASSREQYRVNQDGSLRTLAVEQTIDGSPMKVIGEVTADTIRVMVETGGKKKEKLLKCKGPVYPAPLLNLYPLLHGVAVGKSVQVQYFDAEAVKVKKVKISVVGVETLPGNVRAFHLRNDLYTFVDNDVWVDMAGNTLRESVRDGLVVTVAEEAATVRKFILEAALAKKDLILDFSLVKVDPPLKNPAILDGLVVELTGVPAGMPLYQGPGQTAVRTGNDRVLYTLGSFGGRVPNIPGAPEPEDVRFLQPSSRIPSDDPEIMAFKNASVAKAGTDAEAVKLLVKKVAEYVEDTVADSQSPLETLRSRKGNCQSHARLYTALARAAGIPSRVASGLVYAQGKGFLYHSWSESKVGGQWLAVDPTFDQIPVDCTHIKLVEGDEPDDMLPLAGVVGRLKARIVEHSP